MSDVITDANGVTLAVGDTVSLVGVVVSINPNAQNYDDVVFTLSHKLPSSASVVIPVPQQFMKLSPGQLAFPAPMLVKGAPA